MGKKSREKGKRGERQARDWWRRNIRLPDVTRGQQFRGGRDSPDLAGIPIFHAEVKVGRKTPNVYSAISQCKDDCRDGFLPVVQLRRDREDWLFVCPEETFKELVNYYLWGEKDTRYEQ